MRRLEPLLWVEGGRLRVRAAINNAELIMHNAEFRVQKCRVRNGDMSMRGFGALLWGRTLGNGCVQGAGICWELRELMGLRFSVDVVSKACDGGRDVQGR